MDEKKESLVGVPLSDEEKKALAERAEKNGRSLGREAANIIVRTVMRNR